MKINHSVYSFLTEAIYQIRCYLGRCIQCECSLYSSDKVLNQPNNQIKYQLICRYCYDDLPLFNLIDLGGDLLHWPAIDRIIKHRTFDHLICISPYQAPFSEWISQFKYKGAFELHHLLAELMASKYQQLIDLNMLYPANCIMPVPMYVKKWQQRGFNQSTLLAKNVATKLQMVFHDTVIFRNQPTKQQVGMSGVDRRKNLRDAFTINWPCANIPEHVMLIDDVVTTGSTANEISRVLKKSGVKKVSILAICLSLPR